MHPAGNDAIGSFSEDNLSFSCLRSCIGEGTGLGFSGIKDPSCLLELRGDGDGGTFKTKEKNK